MAKWEVCPACQGEGALPHPALRVWLGEDIAADPEGFRDTLAGNYDVPCQECNGRRVVLAEDFQTYPRRRAERTEEIRIRAMESGDPELYRDAYLY